MNWLEILVIVIIAGYTLNGRRRGFIKTVFTLFSTIIALLLTMWISPMVNKEVQKNEKVMTFVNHKVEKVVDFGKKNDKTSEQMNFIDKLFLPGPIKNALKENNTGDVYTAMAVNSFEEYITGTISRIIINAAVFIIVMLLVMIILGIISSALDIISKLPLINGLNKTAGLLAGLLHGIIITWIGFILLTMFSSTNIGKTMFLLINESKFLTILYDNNLLLRYITDIGKILF
ncbi:CvpA family protein [Anaerocolumna sp.]|uniref:CvpA family protein n=1 Tax=Anaerocolumna sp. TaxID=2041569 RepID=UPI0028AB2AC8|nr:CvpA family protein [Anaerocolumna sp.]